MASVEPCFHCALPVPRHCKFTVALDGEEQAVCCAGCKGVAELILSSGLKNYYSQRDLPPPGTGKPADDAPQWRVFNSKEMTQSFAVANAMALSSNIYVGGMYCAACSWLIDTSLRAVAGVDAVDIDPVTHRIRVQWREDELGLGDILATLANLGYYPQPLSPNDETRPELNEQRSALKRLLVAALGMMQVMMIAVGLYAGDYQGIDVDMQQFLRLISFLVTTPVVFYSARPFFDAAWRGLKSRMPGMDLPVSIAIGAAYAASVYVTFTGGSAVWFDSVTMFVFFLTLGRFLEMRARHRSIDRSTALSQLLPNTATRVVEDRRDVVPVSQLVVGDHVIIRSGETVPADGVVISGEARCDESLLTGEARAVRKVSGEFVVAGSTNIDGLITISVRRTGIDTTLSAIACLSEQARYSRPTVVHLADRIASHFVVALLAIAASVASTWYFVDAERAFVITLSVLVVTCPCALALATPAAFAAAGSRMSQLKLLLTNSNAVPSLAAATHAVFDKTGTLTSGKPTVVATRVFDERFSVDDCLRIAATLERDSAHPIAAAFRNYSDYGAVTQHKTHVGEGISATLHEQSWRIGKPEFAHYQATPKDSEDSVIYLGVDEHCIAEFQLQDELRSDAVSTIAELRRLGLSLSILSGDQKAAVRSVAQRLGIKNYHYECSPDDKLQNIVALQTSGERVVMIGDGINDAPVLAAADTSIALSDGAQLAQTSADIVMLGTSLQPLNTALTLSRKTVSIVRQNIVWAITYNTLALPLAALGFVPPWLAAVGMSASSLIVVLNALRLGRVNAS